MLLLDTGDKPKAGGKFNNNCNSNQKLGMYKQANEICKVCLGFGAIGSEFVQGLLPYRQFDPMDIVANLLGSTTSLLLMQWYHNRMLERRRLTRGRYGPVATEDAQEPDLEAGSELQDMGSNHEQEEELPAVKTPP